MVCQQVVELASGSLGVEVTYDGTDGPWTALEATDGRCVFVLEALASPLAMSSVERRARDDSLRPAAVSAVRQKRLDTADLRVRSDTAAGYSQRSGSTVSPFWNTMKCRWHPVEYPVVPTYPMISPRSTCWPV